MSRQRALNRAEAEIMAIEALRFLAGDPERLGRFLALTGLGPGDLRAAARTPAFLAGILEHLCGEEALLIAFAQSVGRKPGAVAQACAIMTGAGGNGDAA